MTIFDLNKKNITQREIARKAQVSPSTVSRVLKGSPAVSSEAYVAVRKAMEDLGLQFPTFTATLKKDHYSIAVLVRDINDPAYAPMLKGMGTVAYRNNHILELYDYGGDPLAEERYVYEAVDRGVDAIISFPSQYCMDGVYAKLLKKGFPLVLLHEASATHYPDATVVGDDVSDTMKSAVEYLSNLNHSKILILFPTDEDILHGTIVPESVHGFGVFQIEQRLIRYCKNSWDLAYQYYISECSMLKFTAVCVFSSTMTMGVWCAINECGKRIPQDYSFIGFGNSDFLVNMNISGIEEPLFEIGQNCVYRCIELVQGHNILPKVLRLPSRLVIRQSCRINDV